MGPPESRRSRFPLKDVPVPWIRFFERIDVNADLYRAILHSSGSVWFQARLRKQVERASMSFVNQAQSCLRNTASYRRPQV